MSDTTAKPTSAQVQKAEKTVQLTGEEKAFETSLSKMSPFEVKNLLLDYAREDCKASTHTLLNAGRGNPNWINTTPREAYYLLGSFGIEEAKRSMNQPDFDLAGMPQKEGIGERFLDFLDRKKGEAGQEFLSQCVAYLQQHGYDLDSVAFEWAQGINGCEYPMPERILDNTQKICQSWVNLSMAGGTLNGSDFDLFATEGTTASMCYLFYSLKCNFLIQPGDKIALMTPIFTPYLNIPLLNDYDLDVVTIQASQMDPDGLHAWQYPEEELQKLADPSIKLLCVVNPSNPPSMAMAEESQKRLAQIVTEKNPNLMIIADDVYGTFVENYRSILVDLPENTACCYSFSKYFGATGCRLAVIAIQHGNNVFDRLIKALPDDKKAVLKGRYSCLTDHIEDVAFIDRMVADSRLVALNGTAGLSTPQQVQMSLFALHGLLDAEQVYQHRMQEILADRNGYLWKSLGWELPENPLRANYYSLIDLGLWAQRLYGKDFEAWLKKNYSSLDIVIRLARDTGIVLMNGAGFDGPDWSVRASLANLDVTDFIQIGVHVKDMLGEYATAWKAETGQ